MQVICDNCGEEFNQHSHWGVVNKHNFCCRDCYYEWRKNIKNHPHWKGGQVKMLGYVFVKKPNHLFANDCGYVKRSRLVMENHLGRYLRPAETMHHINGIRDDDRIENLRLFDSNGEHISYHAYLRKVGKQLQLIGA